MISFFLNTLFLGKLPSGSLPKEKILNDLLNKQNSQNGSINIFLTKSFQKKVLSEGQSWVHLHPKQPRF